MGMQRYIYRYRELITESESRDRILKGKRREREGGRGETEDTEGTIGSME
jgi:hypothetical protein